MTTEKEKPLVRNEKELGQFLQLALDYILKNTKKGKDWEEKKRGDN